MGQTQTVFMPPWEPTTEAEKERTNEFRTAILGLSNHSANFLTPHHSVHESDFSFDWFEHRTFAEAAYTGDVRLGQLIPRLVPKQCAPLPLAFPWFFHHSPWSQADTHWCAQRVGGGFLAELFFTCLRRQAIIRTDSDPAKRRT